MTTTFDERDEPFGNPDGSRADLEDVLQGFVSFGGRRRWGGLATTANDLSARVIVGRKGSGKTVYLRRLQAYASQEGSVYAEPIQQSLPTTEQIIRFCQFFDVDTLTEQWMKLWKAAIFRSVFSHLLKNPKLQQVMPTNTAETIEKDYSHLLRRSNTPLSVYSQVTEIINHYVTRHQVTAYLDDPKWAELEWFLGETIRQFPPLYFYIDAVDEEFSHAPMYWLQCQKGLFYQVMRLLRDSKLGGRLHIVICVRDVVLSSVYRSEHQTRYRGESHIRVLSWDREAISYFMDQKIAMLDDQFFIQDPKVNEKTINTFLGLDSIFNERRQITEPIKQYLLRHTRLLPRDIVRLGNLLCEEMARNNGDLPMADVVRRCVRQAAREFGNEQLVICANELSSSTMPNKAGVHGYSDVYTGTYKGSQEYMRGLAAEIRRLLLRIGKDRFSQTEMEAVPDSDINLLGYKDDVYSALWRHGLLGYIEESQNGKESVTFFSERTLDDFNLPRDKPCYVLHSCLIDSIGIRSVGKEPVIPA